MKIKYCRLGIQSNASINVLHIVQLLHSQVQFLKIDCAVSSDFSI